MAKGFKSGGSGGISLNFKVVPYAAEAELPAAAPAENTIGVITDQKITGWAFSSEAPENPVEGMVHFATASAAAAEFNALKKNSIQVCPTGCAQYIGGKWVGKDAKTYQSGAWQSWVLKLYDHGTFYDIAGSLKTSNSRCKFTLYDDYVYIAPIGGEGGHVYFDKKIDLTAYKTLVFLGSAAHSNDSYTEVTNIGVWETIGGSALAELTGARGEGEHLLDISELSGECYIGFYVQGFTDFGSIRMQQMYLK